MQTASLFFISIQVNSCVANWKFGCLRYPGASSIGSPLLEGTAPMASKSWQLSHEPPRAREKAGTRHTKQVSGNRQGRGWNHYKLSSHNCEMPIKVNKCSLKTSRTCQNARRRKTALEHATMHTTARACGIVMHAHLTSALASKIRLALLNCQTLLHGI